MARFRSEQGGDWVVQWHPATGTPSAIYGTGMPIADWRESSLEEARRHALQVLARHQDLLGLGSSSFVESIGARMGRTWSFTFDQYFRGLPVIDGRADVRIHRKGVVAMLGSRAWPIADTFDTTPAITDDVATAIAWHEVGAPANTRQPVVPKAPRLVIWGNSHAQVLSSVALAWEVAVSNVADDGTGPAGRYYIDAHSGAVLQFVNDKHQCAMPGCTHATPACAATAEEATPPPPATAEAPATTTVTVMAWTRIGVDAFAPLVNVALPGLQLNVPGIGTVTTDDNGECTINIAAPVSITVGALDGRHHAPISGSSAPSGSFTVNPGVNSTIQLLSAAATFHAGAHTTTSYWIDRANEWCRGILGNTPQLDTADAIAPSVNFTSSCNAYYLNNSLTFFVAGAGCSNTAFSSVIVHEWGHGLDDRYGGISNEIGDGLSEGWADLLAIYLLDDPNYGSGFYMTPGVPARSGNNTKMYGTQVDPHDAGEVWMGFAWRYRENLRAVYGTPTAIQVSEDTVVASLVANAGNQADAVREVFLADDDDGNLLNGVPHYAQLSAAAIAKGMPYPQIPAVSILHAPLGDTTDRHAPRAVMATITPNGGALNAARLHFDVGSGGQVRNLHPDGTAGGYVAMLPGRPSGTVSYHLEVDHSSGVTVRRPTTGEFTYTIGLLSPLLTEDFENGAPGWSTGASTGTNEWQLGAPAGRSGTVGGISWADPASAVSGTKVYGIDLGIGAADGRYDINTNQYLRSPILDCTGRFGVRLRFKRWLSVERATYDRATISVNGTPIWSNPVATDLTDTSWQTLDYPLPSADDNPSVQIEWRLVSDYAIGLGGWQIDDVELTETILAPVDALLTMLPEQAVQGAPMTTTMSTPGGPRPYLLVIGDSAGPTIVPGLPPLFVGGNLITLGGSTDAQGLDVIGFTAPNVPSAVGLLFHSQALTVDAGFTAFVTSTRCVNLFTQTP